MILPLWVLFPCRKASRLAKRGGSNSRPPVIRAPGWPKVFLSSATARPCPSNRRRGDRKRGVGRRLCRSVRGRGVSPEPKPGILEIEPYVAGRSPILGERSTFKLSSNESALGASPKAIAAYQAARN